MIKLYLNSYYLFYKNIKKNLEGQNVTNKKAAVGCRFLKKKLVVELWRELFWTKESKEVMQLNAIFARRPRPEAFDCITLWKASKSRVASR